MKIKVVDEQGVEQAPPKGVSPDAPESPIGEGQDLDVLALAQVFNLDPKETKEEEKKLKTLVDWAKTQVAEKEPNQMNIKLAIRNLESRLGSPPLGETRLIKAHRFAHLELQEQEIRAAKEQMYVGG